MLERIEADGSHSSDFVSEFKVFAAELRDFFNAGSFADMLGGLRAALEEEEEKVNMARKLVRLLDSFRWRGCNALKDAGRRYAALVDPLHVDFVRISDEFDDQALPSPWMCNSARLQKLVDPQMRISRGSSHLCVRKPSRSMLCPQAMSSAVHLDLERIALSKC